MLFFRFTKEVNLLVSFYRRNGYNWMIFSKKSFKFFKKNLNFFFFKNRFFKKKYNMYRKIKSIVLFKKKTGTFKRKNKIQMAFMRRLNTFKFKKNRFTSFFLKKRVKFGYTSKYLDLHRRTNQIYYVNRNIFKDYLGSNKIRQWALTRVFTGFTKVKPKQLLLQIENSIQYTLIAAKFAFTLKEAKFLINSNIVHVNGEVVSNEYSVVNVGDVVQVGLSDKFFKFYRVNFHLKTRVFKRISYSLWLMNRLKYNFYKQSRNRIPFWINNLFFVYEDVPTFLEVDYSILTICIVLRKTKFNQFNFFTKKIVALFLLRHYNWNYIT